MGGASFSCLAYSRQIWGPGGKKPVTFSADWTTRLGEGQDRALFNKLNTSFLSLEFPFLNRLQRTRGWVLLLSFGSAQYSSSCSFVFAHFFPLLFVRCNKNLTTTLHTLCWTEQNYFQGRQAGGRLLKSTLICTVSGIVSCRLLYTHHDTRWATSFLEMDSSLSKMSLSRLYCLQSSLENKTEQSTQGDASQCF